MTDMPVSCALRLSLLMAVRKIKPRQTKTKRPEFCVLENISPKKRLSGISPGGKKQTVSYSIGRPGRSPWIGLCTHPLDVRPAPRGGVFWGWFESNSCCDVGTDSWGLACPTQPFRVPRHQKTQMGIFQSPGGRR